MKLDKKDKKIAKILEHNARMSIAEISRKTGIQRDSVLYRLNKMVDNGVIKFFTTVLEPGVFGYPIHTYVNFVLYNLDSGNENKFRNYLKAHHYVSYAAKTTGRWDFTVNIVAKDLKHLDKILTEIRMKFSTIIKEYQTSSILDEFKYDEMSELIE